MFMFEKSHPVNHSVLIEPHVRLAGAHHARGNLFAPILTTLCGTRERAALSASHLRTKLSSKDGAAFNG